MGMETETPHMYACAPEMEVEVRETCQGYNLMLIEAGPG
jgi:hypothetical protein